MKNTAILFAIFLVSATALNAQRRLTAEEYIEKYKELAIIEQEIFGIPASVKMGQALLESDCGNSRLATLGNNHFGIKCKKEWTGETILHDDDALQECFRKYPSTEQSFRDHSEFLENSLRYQSLFLLEPTDYKGWARGLKDAGYATNPKYAELLIGMIERYELYALDAMDPGPDLAIRNTAQPPVPQKEEDNAPARIDIDNYAVSVSKAGGHQVFYNNGSEFVTARYGETYEAIAASTGVAAAKLRKFNDAAAGYQPDEGEQVYIRAKKNKANNGKMIHLAKRNESLRHVSQMFGIKLVRLARLNRMDADSRLSDGQQIRLR